MKEEKLIRLGGLGPLTLPGLPWAGRELEDGMRLAVQQLNGSGGVLGKPLTLVFEDTHGQPAAGVAAVERLREEGVHALAGEFHSVVADAIVEPVETSNGTRISMDYTKQYGREPTFVALEGFDSVLVLARAFGGAGTTEPASVRDALRRIEVEGTRGTIRFSTEHEGVVHQQWKWPPVCVVAHSRARQSFSEADLLWDAEHAPGILTKSLRRAG